MRTWRNLKASPAVSSRSLGPDQLLADEREQVAGDRRRASSRDSSTTAACSNTRPTTDARSRDLALARARAARAAPRAAG